MHFMVYLNGILQPVNNYTIDVDGNITVAQWRSTRPLLACCPGDTVTIMWYEAGVIIKRTDNLCDAYVQIGETPTYSSTETEIF